MRLFLKILLLLFASSTKAQVYDWVSLPQSPNWWVNDLCVYNGSLIAVGNFTSIGGVNMNRVAAWNGSSWSPLGKGIRGNNNSFCNVAKAIDGELYVGGYFDSAGVVYSKNIAKWDGTDWVSISSGGNGEVYCIEKYNGEIYAGGDFSHISGVNALRIARWNGQSWNPLTTGIYGTIVVKMKEYQGKLFVLGAIDSAGGIRCKNLATWYNNAWDSVPGGIKYGHQAIIEWNNNLLFGHELKVDNWVSPPKVTLVTKQWNGSIWSTFSDQEMFRMFKLYSFNNRLICSGGNSVGPPGYSFVATWDDVQNKWVSIGTGINNTTQALCEYNGELYCGGRFNTAQGSPHNYMAKLTDVTSVKERQNTTDVAISPNPADKYLTLRFKTQARRTIKISNSIGQTVCTEHSDAYQIKVEVSDLPCGVYYLETTSDSQREIRKVIIAR
jgi:trimeric autotransporter adhesin